jgi:hypothetical protein
LPVAVAAFQHLIRAPGCREFCAAAVFADQQIGGSPDVAVRNCPSVKIGRASVYRPLETEIPESRSATPG